MLIGGLAGSLHGSPAHTNDADIVPLPSASNYERLSRALRSLGAELRTDAGPVPFDPHPALLQSMAMLHLTARFGDLDLATRPAGGATYDELARSAVAYDVEGMVVRAASLDHVIASKRAADRPKDRVTIPILQALREELGQAAIERNRAE